MKKGENERESNFTNIICKLLIRMLDLRIFYKLHQPQIYTAVTEVILHLLRDRR